MLSQNRYQRPILHNYNKKLKLRLQYLSLPDGSTSTASGVFKIRHGPTTVNVLCSRHSCKLVCKRGLYFSVCPSEWSIKALKTAQHYHQFCKFTFTKLNIISQRLQEPSGRGMGRYGHLQLRSYLAHQLGLQVQVQVNVAELLSCFFTVLCAPGYNAVRTSKVVQLHGESPTRITKLSC